MPGSRLIPPRPTMQNGVRVTSTKRTGSQYPIDRPMRGGFPHEHMGEDGFAMSSCPCVIMGTAPMLIGKTQLQQMSVMGFMNLPWQVGPAHTPAERQARAPHITAASQLGFR